MNKTRLLWMPAAMLVFMMVFAACRNPVEPGESPGVQSRYGTVRISFNGGSSRTVFPNKDFDAYVYTFTPDGGAAQVLTPVNGAFTLETGDWNVQVDAYVGAVSPANKAAWGSANFTLAANEAKVVQITLEANETTGAGTFSYRILYPAGTTVETFTLKKMPELTNVALNPQPGTTVLTGTVANVPAGAYMLDIQLANGGLYAGANEVVYIYALLTTEYGTLAAPIVFEGQDFLSLFTDLGDAVRYLNEHTGGNSAADPILLPLAYDLGYMPQSGSGWMNLLDVIAAADKYVALDLSACTMSGGPEFDPAYFVATGKDKIISLDLPDVAASIAAGSGSGGSFMNFSNLSAVTAKYVTDIGNQAFYDPANHPDRPNPAVSSLTSVSFPALTGIGYAAFSYCNGLITISFSAFADISNNPFNGCFNLTNFKLFGNGPLSVIEDGKAVVKNNTELMTYPAASGNITIDTITSISDNAFARCANLTGVSFLAVTSVAGNAFMWCYNLESVSFAAMTSIPSLSDIRGSLKNVSFAAVTSIPANAFYGYTSLESASFPLVTSIGDSAFDSCTSLTSVFIPAATSIGNWAFYDCTGLISVSFPASTNIVTNPFTGCINLTTITLTGTGSLSVIANGKVLLRNGTELVAYPSASGTLTMNAITSIGSRAFHSTGLESVSFPAVINLGNAAFAVCTGLTGVSFPVATSIGDYAFAVCTSLESVSLGATPPTLGTEIFGRVDSAKNVTVRFPFDGAAAYGNAPTDTVAQNWGNAFRGMGWNGTAYLDGEVNANINLTYDGIDGNTDEGRVSFAYYWVNEQDLIATTNAGAGNAFTLSFGNSLTITANGGGYTNQRWFIDGVEDSTEAGSPAYVFSSVGKLSKQYTVGLIVEKGGRYYNANFVIKVGEV